MQLCRDAHLSDFGVFASPERHLIFDINDFDETLPGPWEWDVKRLAASFEIAGRDLGFSPADRRDIVLAGVHDCREQLREASPDEDPRRGVRPSGRGSHPRWHRPGGPPQPAVVSGGTPDPG